MQNSFRIAFTAALPLVAGPAAAQSTTSFDGSYVGASLQVSGDHRGCTTTATAPGPLTVSGGVARAVLGPQGNIIFEGPVDARGTMQLRGSTGTVLNATISGGTANGYIVGSLCNYTMSWRKR
jgi:hypothetical protein